MTNLIPDPQLASWHHWNHMGALRLLFLLYRRPRAFRDQLSQCSVWGQLGKGFSLYLHALPWTFLIILLGRALASSLGLSEEYRILDTKATTDGIIFVLALSLPTGIFLGCLLATVVGIAGGIAVGIIGGIAACLVAGVSYGIAGIAAELSTIRITGVFFGGFSSPIIWNLAENETIGIVGAIVTSIITGLCIVGLDVGVSVWISVGLAEFIILTRLYYLPCHWFIYRLPKHLRVQWYCYHPVAWDDLCSIPFKNLSVLLQELREKDPIFGSQEIERLAAFPAQDQEVLIAQSNVQVTFILRAEADDD